MLVLPCLGHIHYLRALSYHYPRSRYKRLGVTHCDEPAIYIMAYGVPRARIGHIGKFDVAGRLGGRGTQRGGDRCEVMMMN